MFGSVKSLMFAVSRFHSLQNRNGDFTPYKNKRFFLFSILVNIKGDFRSFQNRKRGFHFLPKSGWKICPGRTMVGWLPCQPSFFLLQAFILWTCLLCLSFCVFAFCFIQNINVGDEWGKQVACQHYWLTKNKIYF